MRTCPAPDVSAFEVQAPISLGLRFRRALDPSALQQSLAPRATAGRRNSFLSGRLSVPRCSPLNSGSFKAFSVFCRPAFSKCSPAVSQLFDRFPALGGYLVTLDGVHHTQGRDAALGTWFMMIVRFLQIKGSGLAIYCSHPRRHFLSKSSLFTIKACNSEQLLRSSVTVPTLRFQKTFAGSYLSP